MTGEYVQLTKQQVISLLVEIAELRCQVTDLTKERDYYQRELDSSLNTRKELRERKDMYSNKLTDIETICQTFDPDYVVCNNCSPRDADCNGCGAPLEQLKEKILNVIMELEK